MILQFGAGNFLRAFADLFISQANQDSERAIGPVVVVQSTGAHRVEALNRARGRYHVAIQGFENGKVIDRTEAVDLQAEGLVASEQWDAVLDIGRDPSLRAILSNTTEAGLALDEQEPDLSQSAPRSFPAKLLAVLLARFDAGQAGAWIIPCELLDNNATRLRELVLTQAERWGLSPDFRAWLGAECRWTNTLVDRIVPGPPKEHPLLDSDPLLIAAEPYALWAVECPAGSFPIRHDAVIESADISGYALRKVRILNGAHSALVCKAPQFGIRTVRECLEHEKLSQWLQELLFEEIVPVLEGRCESPEGFAREVLDRFRNPFLEHQLSAIALNHEAKIAVRLRPTLEEYRERFGKEPMRLAEIL